MGGQIFDPFYFARLKRIKALKSYTAHLKTTQSYGEKLSPEYRPTMRSSAVFPLIHKPNKLYSIYTFMGYWLRKRNIPVVTALVTVRDEYGKKIFLKSIEINAVKSFVISSSDLVNDLRTDFKGSVEIEIFSAIDMVFPYPAITFALQGINGVTFVHTCGRIYNDFDDLNANIEKSVRETGFDIYLGRDYTPFFSFVNGPIAIENEVLELEYINSNGKSISRSVTIESVPPYGLCWINLNFEKVNDITHKSIKQCVKIKHNFQGFFPRFVAGNVLRDFEDVSLTHSYYDTSSDFSRNSTWQNSDVEEFEDSVVPIPFDTKFSSIELAIYPNFARSPVTLRFDLHTETGQLICSKISDIEIGTNDDKLVYVDLIEMFSDYASYTPKGMVRIICLGNGSVPSRMKFGLNFINFVNETNLPSNICFNAQVPNAKLLNKPGTFKWCPIFNAQSQKIYLHNSSFVKNGFIDANIKVEVYRSSDKENLAWSFSLPYNGTIDILENHAPSVDTFLNGEIGWISFTCSSPFISGYYITDYGKGVIGADHLY